MYLRASVSSILILDARLPRDVHAIPAETRKIHHINILYIGSFLQ